MAVIKITRKKASVFIIDRHFNPSLIFSIKVRTIQVEHFRVPYHSGDITIKIYMSVRKIAVL